MDEPEEVIERVLDDLLDQVDYEELDTQVMADNVLTGLRENGWVVVRHCPLPENDRPVPE